MTMYFKHVSDFVHMGGYADYVFSAYGVVIFVLALNLYFSFKKKS